MADKVNSTRTTPYPYRATKGTYSMRTFRESTCVSTSVIRYGDVVQLDVNVSTASGRVRKASTSANVPNIIFAAGVALGIAAEASGFVSSSAPTATAPGGNVLVYLADQNTEFWFPTKSSAVTSTVIGQIKALAYDSTLGMFYCDIANSTTGDASVVVTDVPEPGTDANNPVIVKFLSTAVSRLVSGAL